MFVVQDISARLLFRNAAHGGCGIERVQQVAHPAPGGQIKLKVGAEMAKSGSRARISGRAADIFSIPGQAVHDVTGYIALFFPVFLAPRPVGLHRAGQCHGAPPTAVAIKQHFRGGHEPSARERR